MGWLSDWESALSNLMGGDSGTNRRENGGGAPATSPRPPAPAVPYTPSPPARSPLADWSGYLPEEPPREPMPTWQESHPTPEDLGIERRPPVPAPAPVPALSPLADWSGYLPEEPPPLPPARLSVPDRPDDPLWGQIEEDPPAPVSRIAPRPDKPGNWLVGLASGRIGEWNISLPPLRLDFSIAPFQDFLGSLREAARFTPTDIPFMGYNPELERRVWEEAVRPTYQALVPPERAATIYRASDDLRQRGQEALAPLARPLMPADTLWGRSMRAGVGDLAQISAGAQEWLGHQLFGIPQEEVLGRTIPLREWAAGVQERYGAEPLEFTLGAVVDPYWLQTSVPRTLTAMVPLMGLGLVAAAAGAVVSRGAGLSGVAKFAAERAGPAAVSRVLESLMEAGGAYNEAMERGGSEPEADEAARKTFRLNMYLTPLDMLQMDLAFKALPGSVRQKLAAGLGEKLPEAASPWVSRFLAVGSEALEEDVQGMIGGYALQDIMDLPSLVEHALSPQAWEARVLGGLMGGMFQSAGELAGAAPDIARQQAAILAGERGAAVLPGPAPQEDPVARVARWEAMSVPELEAEHQLLGPRVVGFTKKPPKPDRDAPFGERERLFAVWQAEADRQVAQLAALEAVITRKREEAAIPVAPTPPGVGNVVTARGPDPNKTFNFILRIRSLDDPGIVASHTRYPELAPNPAYPWGPLGLQGREREARASREWLEAMRKEFVAAMVVRDSGRLDEGPLIIGPDGIIESGNGRWLLLNLLRDEEPEKFAEYQREMRAALSESGISEADLVGIKDPILIRERITPLTPEQRVEFTDIANQPTIPRLSAREQATSDTRRLPDELLSRLTLLEAPTAEAAFSARANAPLVEHFVAQVPSNERGTLVDAEGGLSAPGLTRLVLAVFRKTYAGDAGRTLAATFIDAIDPGIKNVESAVYGSLPAMAQAEALIRMERRDPALSLAEDLARAVNVLARLKKEGIRPRDYVANFSMFERELTLVQEQILVYLDDNMRSSTRVREALNRYAALVEASPDLKQGMLLKMVKPSKEELVGVAILEQAIEGARVAPPFAAQAEAAAPAPEAVRLEAPVVPAAPAGVVPEPEVALPPDVRPSEMTRTEFDATRAPLLHGTSRPFERFGEGEIRDRYGRPITADRFYFTEQDDVARTFANSGGFKQVDSDHIAEELGLSPVEHQAELVQEIREAIDRAIAKGKVAAFVDHQTGSLQKAENAASIPEADLLDGDVRVYDKDRWPRVIKADVYGRALDLTNPDAVPDDLRAILQGTNFRPWEVSLPDWQHEYSEPLIQYASDNGYGKIKVRDAYESGFVSIIALKDFIGYGVDPYLEFVKRAVEDGSYEAALAEGRLTQTRLDAILDSAGPQARDAWDMRQPPAVEPPAVEVPVGPPAKEPWQMSREGFEQGRWYHGTTDIDKVEQSGKLITRQEGARARNAAAMGYGVYLSSDLDEAKAYLPSTGTSGVVGTRLVGSPRLLEIDTRTPQGSALFESIRKMGLDDPDKATRHVRSQDYDGILWTLTDGTQKVVVYDSKLVGPAEVVLRKSQPGPDELASDRDIVETGTHRALVNKALSEGKPVPPEVLADYPDLQQAAVEAPVAPTVVPPTATIDAQFGQMTLQEMLSREKELTQAIKQVPVPNARDFERPQAFKVAKAEAEATAAELRVELEHLREQYKVIQAERASRALPRLPARDEILAPWLATPPVAPASVAPEVEQAGVAPTTEAPPAGVPVEAPVARGLPAPEAAIQPPAPPAAPAAPEALSEAEYDQRYGTEDEFVRRFEESDPLVRTLGHGVSRWDLITWNEGWMGNAHAEARRKAEALGLPINEHVEPGRGWKIHLNVNRDPALARRISDWLQQRHVPHKIGHSGGQIGKDMTVYVGWRDAVDALATDLDHTFGQELGPPVGNLLKDDLPIAGNVWGRFEIVHIDPEFSPYGGRGFPWTKTLVEMISSVAPSAEPASRALANAVSLTRLAERYGPAFTGTRQPPAITVPTPEEVRAAAQARKSAVEAAPPAPEAETSPPVVPEALSEAEYDGRYGTEDEFVRRFEEIGGLDERETNTVGPWLRALNQRAVEAAQAAGFPYSEAIGPGKGWKIHLHLSRNPELAKRISTWLIEQGVPHKVGHGDQMGKDMTIYVGMRDAVEEVASAIDRTFGLEISPPTGAVLHDDIALVGNVWARFDIHDIDGDFSQYGGKGFPDLMETRRRVLNNLLTDTRIITANNNYATAHARLVLTERYGASFIGSRAPLDLQALRDDFRRAATALKAALPAPVPPEAAPPELLVPAPEAEEAAPLEPPTVAPPDTLESRLSEEEVRRQLLGTEEAVPERPMGLGDVANQPLSDFLKAMAQRVRWDKAAREYVATLPSGEEVRWGEQQRRRAGLVNVHQRQVFNAIDRGEMPSDAVLDSDPSYRPHLQHREQEGRTGVASPPPKGAAPRRQRQKVTPPKPPPKEGLKEPLKEGPGASEGDLVRATAMILANQVVLPTPIAERLGKVMARSVEAFWNIKNAGERWDTQAARILGRPLTETEKTAVRMYVEAGAARAAAKHMKHKLQTILQRLGPDLMDELNVYLMARDQVDKEAAIERMREAEREKARIANEPEPRFEPRQWPYGTDPSRVNETLREILQGVAPGDWQRQMNEVRARMGDKTFRHIDLKKMRGLLRGVGPKNMAKIEQAAGEITAYVRELLDMRLQYEVINQETRDQLVNSFPHYVPIRIVKYLDTLEDKGAVRRNLGTAANLLYHLTQEGTEAAQMAPLDALIDLTNRTYSISFKNDTARTIAKVAQLSPELSTLIHQRDPDKDLTTGEAEFPVRLNGELQYWVATPDWANLVRIDDTFMGPALQTAAYWLRTPLKMGATQRNPVFLLINFMADLTNYVMMGGGIPAYIRTAPDTLTEGPISTAYEMLGGGMGRGTMYKEQTIQASHKSVKEMAGRPWYVVDSPRKLLDFLVGIATLRPIEDLGNRVENLSRTAGFWDTLTPQQQAEVLAGDYSHTPVTAVAWGRRIAMDFDVMGELGRIINAFVPYFNPAWQGPAQIARLLADPKRRPGGILRIAGFMVAMAALHAYNRRFPEYDDVPEYEKNRGLVVMLPWSGQAKDTQGKPIPAYAILAPMREWGVFAIAVRELLDAAQGKPRRGGWRTYLAMQQSLSPISGAMGGEVVMGLLPPVPGSIIEGWANYDLYRGRPIIPEELAAEPLEKQVRMTTPESARWLGNIINMSPALVEHYIISNLAGVGRLGMDVGNLVLQAMNQMPPPVPQEGERLFARYVPHEGEALTVGAESLDALRAEALAGNGALYVVAAKDERGVDTKLYAGDIIESLGIEPDWSGAPVIGPVLDKLYGRGRLPASWARAPIIGNFVRRFYNTVGGQLKEEERIAVDTGLGQGTAEQTAQAWRTLMPAFDRIREEQLKLDARYEKGDISNAEWVQERKILVNYKQGVLYGMQLGLPLSALENERAREYKRIVQSVQSSFGKEAERAEVLATLYYAITLPDGLEEQEAVKALMADRKAFIKALDTQDQKALQDHLRKNVTPKEREYFEAQETISRYYELPKEERSRFWIENELLERYYGDTKHVKGTAGAIVPARGTTASTAPSPAPALGDVTAATEYYRLKNELQRKSDVYYTADDERTQALLDIYGEMGSEDRTAWRKANPAAYQVVAGYYSKRDQMLEKPENALLASYMRFLDGMGGRDMRRLIEKVTGKSTIDMFVRGVLQGDIRLDEGVTSTGISVPAGGVTTTPATTVVTAPATAIVITPGISPATAWYQVYNELGRKVDEYYDVAEIVPQETVDSYNAMSTRERSAFRSAQPRAYASLKQYWDKRDRMLEKPENAMLAQYMKFLDNMGGRDHRIIVEKATDMKTMEMFANAVIDGHITPLGWSLSPIARVVPAASTATTQVQAQVPTMTKVEAKTAGDYQAYAQAMAVEQGINPDLFLQQIGQESGWNPKAVSSKGAIGIAQIVPKYHPGVDPTDPWASLEYAAKLMRKHLDKYGDLTLALIAYNGGDGAVKAWQAGKPYRESQAYVTAILGGKVAPAPGTAKAPATTTTAPTTEVDVGDYLARRVPIPVKGAKVASGYTRWDYMNDRKVGITPISRKAAGPTVSVGRVPVALDSGRAAILSGVSTIPEVQEHFLGRVRDYLQGRAEMTRAEYLILRRLFEQYPEGETDFWVWLNTRAPRLLGLAGGQSVLAAAS